MLDFVMRIFLLLFIWGHAFALLAQFSDYYRSADGLTGEELKGALHDIVKNHEAFPYTSTRTDVWDILKEADQDTLNPANVRLFYTNRSVNAAQEYNSGAGWSREHVWAKSRGDFGTTLGAGTDCHHLRAADVSVNSTRNNRFFYEGGDSVMDENVFTGCFISREKYTFEPRNDVKGDVARMLFYMAVRYEGVEGDLDLELTEEILGSSDKLPKHGVLSLLMQWHLQDPPDNFEKRRNTIIQKYQGNRNPFIDKPEMAPLIWGIQSSLTNSFTKIKVFPNPVFNTLKVKSQVPVLSLSIFDVMGHAVLFCTGSSSIAVSTLPAGHYVLLVRTDSSVEKTRFVKIIR